MPSTTITYTAQEGQRFAAAVGRDLRLTNGGGAPRSATEAEAKEWLIAQMKKFTLDNERAEAEKAISLSPFQPT